MGIILTTTGLPLLSIGGHPIAGSAFAEEIPFPEPKPDPEPRQPDPDPGPAEFDLNGPVHEIAYRGATFTFSEPVYWLESANGDPVVITSEEYLPRGTSITSISPASTTNATDFKVHGAVKNPNHYPDGVNSSAQQGFDERMTVRPSGSIRTAYRDSMNVDPANTSEPIIVAQGDAFSIVKAISDLSLSDTSGKAVEAYVPLTFMNALPPRAGTWFRPSLTEVDKVWPKLPVEEMDFSGGSDSPLRNLPAYDGVQPPSARLAAIENSRSRTIPIWAGTGEDGRKMQLSREGDSNYSEYIMRSARSGHLSSLFSDWSGNPTERESRKDLACILIQWGIDRDGADKEGYHGQGGAGQFWGYHPFYYLAAFMLQDPEMLYRCQWHGSNSLSLPFWVTEDYVGYPMKWDRGFGRPVRETYQAEMLGLPEWNISSWFPRDAGEGYIAPKLAGKSSSSSASWDSEYRASYHNAGPLEVLPIYLLRNGPNGETGADVVNRGLPVGPENLPSAPLPYVDRYMTFWTAKTGNVAPSATVRMYEAWRDFVPQARWKGQPDAVASHKFDPQFIPAGAGEVAVDLSDYLFTTKDIDTWEVSYSMDNVQFSDPITVSKTDTIEGLRPGTDYWFRFRRRNVDGEWSYWSQTWMNRPRDKGSDGEDRNKIKTSGSPSGMLANIVPPRLMWRPYAPHPMPYYERASEKPAADVYPGLTIYAGIGLWTGGGKTLNIDYTGEVYDERTISGWDVSFQWMRDGAPIDGATGFSYMLAEDDRGHEVKCELTVEGQIVSTDSVLIAQEPVLARLRAETNGPISLSPSVFTTSPSGVIHWVVTESDAAPTKAQIQAGQDRAGLPAAYSGKGYPMKIGDFDFTTRPVGLAPSTQYFVHAYQVDAEENESSVVSSSAVFTDAPGTISLLQYWKLQDPDSWSRDISIPMPETIRAGSLLVAVFHNVKHGKNPDVEFAPGWELHSQTNESRGLQIYSRIADGTEGGANLAWPKRAMKTAGVLFEFADMSPVTVAGVNFALGSQPPELDLGGDNAAFWAAGIVVSKASGRTAETPEEYENALDVWTNPGGSTSSNEGGLAVAYRRELMSFDAPSEYVWTSPSHAIISFTLAVRAG